MESLLTTAQKRARCHVTRLVHSRKQAHPPITLDMLAHPAQDATRLLLFESLSDPYPGEPPRVLTCQRPGPTCQPTRQHGRIPPVPSPETRPLAGLPEGPALAFPLQSLHFRSTRAHALARGAEDRRRQ